ncbi:MAG: hypothetical protein JWQ92_1970 [Amnibacterium sp.]|nr:hypothetical protein [Amnibacterium sp.]
MGAALAGSGARPNEFRLGDLVLSDGLSPDPSPCVAEHA